ncbi:MAG: helix-turn-helix transcriptional regulator [Lachnospiraceae bacterium]|nr:helix-turn-helix transcriptional regulator [Lachnospiraceae bacterium]
MLQGERVKEIRKSLGLTTEKFGEKLGIQRSAVSKIENGRCSLTDANIKAICREFNVDYMWLTTGEGEMFVETDDDFMEKIDRIMVNENDARRNIFKALLYASDDDVAALARIMNLYNDMEKD